MWKILFLTILNLLLIKDKIKSVIEETITECNKALFVFDEIDKIPIGLMDTIKAYIDFNQEIDGNDYRSSVFIFLRFLIKIRLYIEK